MADGKPIDLTTKGKCKLNVYGAYVFRQRKLIREIYYFYVRSNIRHRMKIPFASEHKNCEVTGFASSEPTVVNGNEAFRNKNIGKSVRFPL